MNRRDLLIQLYEHPLIQQMLVNELLSKRQLIDLVLLEAINLHEEDEENYNPDGSRFKTPDLPDDQDEQDEKSIAKEMKKWISKFREELRVLAISRLEQDKKLNDPKFKKLFGKDIKTFIDEADTALHGEKYIDDYYHMLAHTSESGVEDFEKMLEGTTKAFYEALEEWFKKNPPANIENIILKKVLVKINENHVDNYPKIKDIIDENKIANIVVKYVSMFLRGKVDKPEDELDQFMADPDKSIKESPELDDKISRKSQDAYDKSEDRLMDIQKWQFWLDYFDLEADSENGYKEYKDYRTKKIESIKEKITNDSNNEETKKHLNLTDPEGKKTEINPRYIIGGFDRSNISSQIIRLLLVDMMYKLKDEVRLPDNWQREEEDLMSESPEDKEDFGYEAEEEEEEIRMPVDPGRPAREKFDFTRFLKLNMKIKNSDAVSDISNKYLSPLHIKLKKLASDELNPEHNFDIKDPRPMREIGKDLSDIEVNKEKLDKIVPYAMNKSSRLNKAIEKMISFVEKDTLKDTTKPMMGKQVKTDRATLGREKVDEVLEPKPKTREEIRGLLKAEFVIQKDFLRVLEFYYDNFMMKQDDLTDLKTNKGRLQELGKNIINKLKDMKKGFGLEGTFVPSDKTYFKVTDELINAFSKNDLDPTLTYELLIRDLPKLVQAGYERLDKVYEEVKVVLKDLQKGKFELSSKLAEIISGLEALKGQNPKDWFDQVISDLKNNKPMKDYQQIFQNISDIENRDIQGLKPDVEPAEDEPEMVAEEESLGTDAQKQYRRNFEEFSDHKKDALTGTQGLRKNLDTVDQANYFKFFQLAGLIADVLGNYDKKQEEIKVFLSNPDNVPQYIKLETAVATKEELLENGLIQPKYAEQVYNSIGRQRELEIAYKKQDKTATGGFDSKDAADLAGTVGTVIDIITVAAFAFPPLAPLAAALKVPANFVKIGEAALHAKNGDNAKAAATLIGLVPLAGKINAEYLLKIPGLNKVITKLGAAVGKEMTEEMVQQVVKKGAEAAIKGATVKAAEKIDTTDPDKAKEQAQSVFGNMMNFFKGGDDKPAGEIEKAKSELENLRDAIDKSGVDEKQKGLWNAFIKDTLNKTVGMEDDDLTDEEYLQSLINAKNELIKQIEQSQSGKGGGTAVTELLQSKTLKEFALRYNDAVNEYNRNNPNNKQDPIGPDQWTKLLEAFETFNPKQVMKWLKGFSRLGVEDNQLNPRRLLYNLLRNEKPNIFKKDETPSDTTAPEKKQEHIERALKPIIEQLLRGKHGKEELYY